MVESATCRKTRPQSPGCEEVQEFASKISRRAVAIAERVEAKIEKFRVAVDFGRVRATRGSWRRMEVEGVIFLV